LLAQLAGRALGAPLRLELRIVHELAGLFLDAFSALPRISSRFMRPPVPDRESSKKTARSEKKMCTADASGRCRAVSLHV